MLGWPPSPKPCPTTPSARSTRAPTGRCCGHSAAAAQQDFRRIPLGGRAKLANPEGAFSFELQGPDPWQRPLPPPPAIASEAFAGEMTECYWLALARDIPYSRYGQEPITAAAIADLRRFADYQGLDARNPVSQHRPAAARGEHRPLYLPVPAGSPTRLGSTPTEQRYRTTRGGQRPPHQLPGLAGGPERPAPTATARFDPTPRFLRNGRDLGEWSHRDFSYQGPLVAALILLDYVARYGPQVLADTNPYRQHPTQTGGVTFGAPDILDQVARSANAAMKAAWYQKWLVHRRLRPEETGGRIHNHLTGAATYPLHPKLTNSPVLARLYSKQGSYLCPAGLPRGLPDPSGLPRRHRRHRRGRGAGPQGDVQPRLRDPRPGGAQRRRPVAASLARASR